MSVSKVGTIAFQFKSDLMVKVSAFFHMITNNRYFSFKGSIVNGIAQVMNPESELHDIMHKLAMNEKSTILKLPPFLLCSNVRLLQEVDDI